MSINWDIYNKRLNINGVTNRDRQINRVKNMIDKFSKCNPSYKEILLNGINTNLIINSGTQAYLKEFQSLPKQNINIGDYVEWANSYWIVYSCDSDNELYKDGKLYQCNYLLKWQNEHNKVLERWVYVSTKNNNGNDGDKVITVGDGRLQVYIPMDEETLKLKKSMSKKFFIDNNTKSPTAYELVGIENVSNTFNGHGIVVWTMEEIAYSPTANDLLYGVCDYVSPTPPPDETTVLFVKISYSGSSTIRIGGNSKTFTATLLNSEQEIQPMTAIWEVSRLDGLKVTINQNLLTLSCDNQDLDGQLVTINVKDEYSGFSSNIDVLLSVF